MEEARQVYRVVVIGFSFKLDHLHITKKKSGSTGNAKAKWTVKEGLGRAIVFTRTRYFVYKR